MTNKRFRKERIKGTGMQFIVDETTRKENSNGSVGYKAYSTTDMTCDELVDLLNALHEDYEKLKQEVRELEKTYAEEVFKIEDKFDEEILALKKENEQLKQDKKRLIGYLHRYGKVDVEDIDDVILNKEYFDEWGDLYD